jgi:hypothetical protein
MNHNPQLKGQTDGSKTIRNVGRQVIGLSVLTMLMSLVAFVQAGSPPIGELGNFEHDSTFYLIPLSVWGLATGIGLTRAWRWARISILLFGGFVALPCALLAVPFLLMPAGGIVWWQALALRVVCPLLFLIPAAIVVRWCMFFASNPAKAYFQTSRRVPTASG